MSVTQPFGHTAHASVDTALYSPAPHDVQMDAFVAPSVSVIEPAGQSAHATVELALYLPASHAVQLVAPVAGVPPTVFVTEPAVHAKHDV